MNEHVIGKKGIDLRSAPSSVGRNQISAREAARSGVRAQWAALPAEIRRLIFCRF
jgi:hypothetical protein